MSSQESGTSSKGNPIRIAGAVAGVGSGLTKAGCRWPWFRYNQNQIAVRNESPLALYKGALPPAVAWGASDSLLLGSLHNYRLFLIRHGVTEPIPGSSDPNAKRLTLFGHWLAGLGAGWTGTILAHPMETLKVKLQMQTQRDVKDRQYKGYLPISGLAPAFAACSTHE
ncbi:hypothetical protein RSOLAG1IB_00795 [Rhizoctonia solani AG-1 IB]|uniref:Uncharacterized protein n=1 Tax=Thanatephorus cucumeris (strain AG1-IB / isolate 7/3/14) TaxID=1108050 RepID=A0A0B7F3Z5_THACB|nr:hypothetical protein RSOLAG1IB_00795 [Rhizoctonia solani AG-1 IB]